MIILYTKAEGSERGVAFPVLVEMDETGTFHKTLTLSYPPNTVEGSKRMRLLINGNRLL